MPLILAGTIGSIAVAACLLMPEWQLQIEFAFINKRTKLKKYLVESRV